jgi:hypothetical protein
MKQLTILLILATLSLKFVTAQKIKFSQEKLGQCDSSQLVEVSAQLFPDTIKWDSLHWKVNGNLSPEKTQLIHSQLGKKLIVLFYYGSPVNVLKDSFTVASTENIKFSESIAASTRYGANISTLLVDDSALFKVTNWNLSSGTMVSSNSSGINLQATGNITITAKYNSGCFASTSIFIPMETKPDLLLNQTVLANQSGIGGTLIGQLSDGSTMNTVNGIALNTNSFSLQLNAGLQNISVTSGSFSWLQQINIERVVPGDYKFIQTRNARWCDSADAEIQITSANLLIDSIYNISMYKINNDTALITTLAGDQIFSIYSGGLKTDIAKKIEREDSWQSEVYVSEINQATCLQSNDAWATLIFPINVVSIMADTLAIPLHDSIKNLSSGNHFIELSDARGCAIAKEISIPKASEACLNFTDAFSPNGDGINDIWTPLVPEGTSVSLKVYSYRNLNMSPINSQLIFEGINSWDGTNKSTGDLAPRAYYYISGTVNYPAYMNMPVSEFKQIIKLEK